MKVVAYINISETELISGLHKSGQDCFSGLYDRYASKLIGMIMKWVKEEEKAEMLLHSTFLKAWRSKNLFDTETENLYCRLCRLARICYSEQR